MNPQQKWKKCGKKTRLQNINNTTKVLNETKLRFKVKPNAANSRGTVIATWKGNFWSVFFILRHGMVVAQILVRY